MTGNDAWDDKPDEFTAAIEKAHPVVTREHQRYALAMRMVGNRHSKGALIDLVNWLLKLNDDVLDDCAALIDEEKPVTSAFDPNNEVDTRVWDKLDRVSTDIKARKQ